MTAVNRVIQALRNEPTDRLPRSFSVAAEHCANDWDVAQVLAQRYPTDIMILDGRATNYGYCNLYQERVDLPKENLAAAINRVCDNNLFKLGIFEFSPWVELQNLLTSDSDLGFDDLLDQLEVRLKPWLDSELDALCLFDPLSVNGQWNKEALNNMNDLSLFYEIFIESLHERDKFAFLDFGGSVFELMPTILKLEPDAIACKLTPELAVSLSDYTGLFKAQSENPDGRRLTFWAEVPLEAVTNQPWPEVKQYIQNILTELNQGNKGVIAHCVWEPEMHPNTVAYTTQAWEQGLPLPPPGVAAAETAGTGTTTAQPQTAAANA